MVGPLKGGAHVGRVSGQTPAWEGPRGWGWGGLNLAVRKSVLGCGRVGCFVVESVFEWEDASTHAGGRRGGEK